MHHVIHLQEDASKAKFSERFNICCRTKENMEFW